MNTSVSSNSRLQVGKQVEDLRLDGNVERRDGFVADHQLAARVISARASPMRWR